MSKPHYHVVILSGGNDGAMRLAAAIARRHHHPSVAALSQDSVAQGSPSALGNGLFRKSSFGAVHDRATFEFTFLPTYFDSLLFASRFAGRVDACLLVSNGFHPGELLYDIANLFPIIGRPWPLNICNTQDFPREYDWRDRAMVLEDFVMQVCRPYERVEGGSVRALLDMPEPLGFDLSAGRMVTEHVPTIVTVGGQEYFLGNKAVEVFHPWEHDAPIDGFLDWLVDHVPQTCKPLPSTDKPLFRVRAEAEPVAWCVGSVLCDVEGAGASPGDKLFVYRAGKKPAEVEVRGVEWDPNGPPGHDAAYRSVKLTFAGQVWPDVGAQMSVPGVLIEAKCFEAVFIGQNPDQQPEGIAAGAELTVEARGQCRKGKALQPVSWSGVSVAKIAMSEPILLRTFDQIDLRCNGKTYFGVCMRIEPQPGPAGAPEADSGASDH